MYATVQPGGGSPNPLNLSQLKTGSDSMQTPASFSSQGMVKKRKRSDHGLETVKREHHVKREGSDLGHVISENNLKSSISNITENGGLVDVEGVKKLVLLMQTDRKLELNSRSMLAAVVAATDRYDCLSQFVQLKGLSVLDEWLQDIHKGKIGGDDKPVQEFLVVLLRALDKLPVSLQALQLCYIGKSVNRLRTHKNLEIQKKARSLVDTWKKRVEAEMNVIDATKSGAVPWTSTRSRLPEVSLGGNRHIRSSSVTMVTASKTPVKSVHVELAINSPTGTVKSAMSPASAKDGHSRLAIGSPSNAVREDRSSSSSQSHNNSRSCSNAHTKTIVSSAKEDARSSTAGSMSVGDQTSIDSSCHHRRSINGYAETGPAECRREVETSKSSRLHKSPAPEKDSIEGNSHKIIVKIPNKGYNHPADSVCGDTVDNPSLVISRSVSPLKHDHSDPNVNEKIDRKRPIASEVNAESWQSNDLKDILSASDEADGSPRAIREEQSSRATEEAAKFLEVSKFASSSLTSGQKAVKLDESSFKSINALIESVKYSEGDISPSNGDDAGMNLLASVAAGEVLARYDRLTPNDSPQRSVPLKVDAIMGYEVKTKSSNDNNVGDDHNQPVDDAREDGERPDDCSDDSLPAIDALCYVGLQFDKLLQSRKNSFPKFEPVTRGLGKEDRIQQVEQCPSNDGRRPDELAMGLLDTTNSSVSPLQRLLNIDESKNLKENVSVATGLMANGIQNSNPLARCALLDDDNKVNIVPCTKVEKKTIVGPFLKQFPEHNMMKSVAADQRSGTGDEISKIKNSSNQTGMQKYDQVVEVVSSNVFSSFDSRAIIIGNLESADENKENVIQYIVSNKEESGSVSMRGIERQVKPNKNPQVKGEKTEECNSNLKNTELKVKFDLNEGFIGDESKYVKSMNLTTARATVDSVNSLPFSASITVAAAAKGPFVYPDDLIKSKGEPGWRGSAATSAFRPAEPRKALEIPLSSSNVVLDSNNTRKHSCRPALDFDLNIPPDEGILEDAAKDKPISSVSARSSGGLDLDLNQVDEATEMMGQYLVRSGHRMETSFLAAKPSSSGGFSNCDVKRIDFDLNNGPSFDETNTEPPLSNQHGKMSSIQSQPLVAAVHRLNNDVGNFSSWFPPGNTYSSVTIPSIFHDRVEQPFPFGTPPRMILGSSTGGTSSLNPDVYWGSVLSSSPAVSFPSSFQYPVFHFGTSFPLPPASFSGGSSAATLMDSSGVRLCFPTVNSQLLGPAAAASASVPSQYPRPYFVSIQDSSNNSSVENSRKWGRQNLDLNAGPGALEMMEGKDEASPLAAQQLSLASSQLLAEEQLRMYHHQVAARNAMKRKDPDGGWDNEGFQFKQASWQ